MITIVELPSYAARARKILSNDEQEGIAVMIASHPACGAVIQGSAGIRKVRFARRGKGKSAGVRVIYYYSDDCPVFLLTIFAKGEKSDLKDAETMALAKLVKQLVETY